MTLMITVCVMFLSVTAVSAETKFTASDGAAGDYFGSAVAFSGDTAVIGAPWDDDNGSLSGSAYVYVRSGSTWSEQQKLTASDGTADSWFGLSVAITGDTAIVGAPYDGDNGDWSGSVYIFVRSGTTWTEQQKITASDGAGGDNFGISVAISGDTVIIGADGDDDSGLGSGSAYVFVRSGTTWSEQQKLTASDGAVQDFFGWSVAISDDTAVIGARWDYGGGSAYVFVRSGTTWSEQQKITASDGAERDEFGYSISVSGETAVIGAWGNDDDGSRSGSAYVFERSGTTWSEQQKLTASDGTTNDGFGWSVAISGDTALIGARGDDDNGESSGAAYVFERSGTTWSEQQKITASDGAANDGFGWSVAVSGDTKVIGAENDDGKGSAYVPSLSMTADVDINVNLQGSGRLVPGGWQIPITIGFFMPGADVIIDSPAYEFSFTTNYLGGYAICPTVDVVPGTYDITAVSEHTLMNVKRSVAIATPSTSVNVGTLLEGDCNGDGIVDGYDFNIVKDSYGKSGDPEYDRRADCNGDGTVDGFDFTILKDNYGKSEGDPGYDDRADCNSDGTVDGFDFTILKDGYGKSGHPEYDRRADFDRDGDVDGFDFVLVKNNYYKSSPIEIP